MNILTVILTLILILFLGSIRNNLWLRIQISCILLKNKWIYTFKNFFTNLLQIHVLINSKAYFYANSQLCKQITYKKGFALAYNDYDFINSFLNLESERNSRTWVTVTTYRWKIICFDWWRCNSYWWLCWYWFRVIVSFTRRIIRFLRWNI